MDIISRYKSKQGVFKYLKNYLFLSLLLTYTILIPNNANAQATINRIDSLANVALQINNVDQSVKFCQETYQLAAKIPYEEGMIKCMTIIAMKNYNSGRYEAAFKALTSVEPRAVNFKNQSYITHILFMKGETYTHLGFYKNGKEILNAALVASQKITDVDKRHMRRGEIFIGLAENNEKASGSLAMTLNYNKRSYAEMIQIDKSSKFAGELALVTENLGGAFFVTKQYDSAKVYFNKAVLIAQKYNIVTVPQFAFADLARLYYETNQTDSAVFYYHKSIKVSAGLKNNYELKDEYLGIAKAFKKLKLPDSAQSYLFRSTQIADSLNRINQAAIKTPLNYILNQQASQSAHRSSKIIIVLCAIFASLFLYIWLHTRLRAKQTAVRLRKMQQELEANLIHPSIDDVEKLKQILSLATQNDPAFFLKFSELYQNFLNRLLQISPQLGASELETCAMLKLNFGTKEIARYTKLSVRAVESKKYRIRKKLNIPSDQDINIWMNGI